MSKHVSREQIVLVRDNCPCFAAQRAARTLAQRFDRAFAPFSMTNGQFSMLNAIVGMDQTTVGALAQFLAMDHSTASSAIKKLEKRKLIKSTAGTEDRRMRSVSATEAGHALLAAMIPVWKREVDSIDEQLGGNQLRKLTAGFSEVTKVQK